MPRKVGKRRYEKMEEEILVGKKVNLKGKREVCKRMEFNIYLIVLSEEMEVNERFGDEIIKYDKNIGVVEWSYNKEEFRVEIHAEGKVDIKGVIGKIKERYDVKIKRVLGLRAEDEDEEYEFYELQKESWKRVWNAVY